MTATLGLVGVGAIAETYVGAASKSGVTITAGFDSDRERPRWWDTATSGATWCDSLEGVVSSKPNAVLVATPSASHVATVHEIWTLDPEVHLLVEKPIATTLADLDELLLALEADRLTPLYHAAYAPEVEWAEQRLNKWVHRHGPVQTYVSFFSDPYDTSQGSQTARNRYDNSWVDSGSNALSVLRRLRIVDSVTNLSWAEEHSSTAMATTSHSSGKEGLIITQWTVTTPSKSTTIQLADGTLVVLDHQATAGRVVTAAPATIETLFGKSPHTPRLVRHYSNLFHKEVVEKHSVFTADDHAALVRMLLNVL